MQQRHLETLLGLVSALALAGCGQASPASSPGAAQLLLDRTLQGGGKQFTVTVDRESYPAHYAALWHTHPGFGSFCVIQGQIQIEISGQQPVALAAGQCWQESPGVVHRPANNSDRPAEAVFYLLAPTGLERIASAPSPS